MSGRDAILYVVVCLGAVVIVVVLPVEFAPIGCLIAIYGGMIAIKAKRPG